MPAAMLHRDACSGGGALPAPPGLIQGTEMNTKTRLLALTTALALSAATAPSAWALQTDFVATGTIYGSYDDCGLFGPACASLDGDTYTATAYIDTSLGTLTTSPQYNQ